MTTHQPPKQSPVRQAIARRKEVKARLQNSVNQAQFDVCAELCSTLDDMKAKALKLEATLIDKERFKSWTPEQLEPLQTSLIIAAMHAHGRISGHVAALSANTENMTRPVWESFMKTAWPFAVAKLDDLEQIVMRLTSLVDVGAALADPEPPKWPSVVDKETADRWTAAWSSIVQEHAAKTTPPANP